MQLTLNNKKNTQFFLPDTFAPKPNAYPKELYFLQELNLYLIDISNGKKKISLIKLIKLFKKILLSREIGLKTIIILIFHYIKEKINRKNITRRSIYQSILTFDSFLKNLKKYKPVYSSYFTNHLAGMMHRYWKDLFPETFNDLNYKPSEFNKNSIIIAMKEADKQVGALLQYAETSNSDLLIISGMGQGSRERESYIGELQFVDFEKFKQIIFGRKIDNLNILPAMLPDICISFDNSERLNYFLKKIELITDLDSNKIFDMPYKPELNTLNLSLKLSKNLVDNNFLIISNKKYKLDQIGLRLLKDSELLSYKRWSLIW